MILDFDYSRSRIIPDPNLIAHNNSTKCVTVLKWWLFINLLFWPFALEWRTVGHAGSVWPKTDCWNWLIPYKVKISRSEESVWWLVNLRSRGLNLTSGALNLTSRGLNLTSDALNLTSRGLNLTSDALNLTSRGLNLISDALNLTSRGLNLTSGALNLTWRGLVTWNFYLFHLPWRKSPKFGVKNWLKSIRKLSTSHQLGQATR